MMYRVCPKTLALRKAIRGRGYLFKTAPAIAAEAALTLLHSFSGLGSWPLSQPSRREAGFPFIDWLANGRAGEI